MRMFVDGKEVTIKELQELLCDLDCGEFDGNSYEIMSLDHISVEGDLYFETERYSVYG